LPIPLVYEPPPPTTDSLYQGEVLGGVVIHRVVAPAVALQEAPEILQEVFPAVIILHPDCDLAQDFAVRAGLDVGQTIDEADPKILPQVLLVALFELETLRPRFQGKDLWRRAIQNQDERYHHLAAATIGAGEGAARLPEYLIDFRRTHAVPPAALYGAIVAGTAQRLARLPLPYLHDLAHRYFSYLGRPGIPDA
jgi:hypothetical protein